MQGFTIGEFKKGQMFESEGNTYKLLKVINHKTGHKGPTYIFIPNDKIHFITVYYDLVHLPQKPNHDETFFLTSNLKSPNNTSKCLGQFFRAGNLEPVSLTFIQKCGETVMPASAPNSLRGCGNEVLSPPHNV